MERHVFLWKSENRKRILETVGVLASAVFFNEMQTILKHEENR